MNSSRDPDFRLLSYLRSDWPVNRRNPRGLAILALYRVAHHAILRWKVTPLHTVFWGAYLIFYRFVTEFILGCELQAGAVIGRALILDHGFSVVINRSAVIGSNCRLRHGVTIGCNVRPDGSQGRSPRVGNFVEFGANAVAVGGIAIGDGAKIAANSLVIEDVPANATVIGVPAKVMAPGS
jgi:putative colanic acid biosynthesis acetyltransferase WcaB